MKIGMMWQDCSNLPLSIKIREAIAYYQNKYGTIPTLIMVNPKTAIDEDCNQFAIEISRSIMKNHIWLGMSNEDNLLSELNIRRIK